MRTARLALMAMFVFGVASVASAQCLMCVWNGGPPYQGICVDSDQDFCSGVCCWSGYGDPCPQPDWVYDCWFFAAKTDGDFAPRKADLAAIQQDRDRIFTATLRLAHLKAVETNRRMQGGMAAEAKRNCGKKRVRRSILQQS